MALIIRRKPNVGKIVQQLLLEDDRKQPETIASILAPYEQQEFIPTNIVEKVIRCTFPTSTIVHTYSPNHRVIKMTIAELLQAPISNWQFNRPADKIRCEDIARYIAISKKPVDTMLFISFNNKKQGYDVIDGIHRYIALTIVKQKTAHLDFISENEFNGDMSWLWNSFIMINVRMNTPEGELIELFKSLNKSNPIPDLYVRDVVKDKREYIQSLATKWQSIYKIHFVSTSKPNRPHINRDRFMDVLDAVYDKHKLTDESKDKLEEILKRTNNHIAQHIPKKLSDTMIQKCQASGCWIFLYSSEELIKML